MARINGTVKLSSTIEPQVAAPLDARSKVATLADLTASSTFPYCYEGMLVYCVEDKKLYQLTGNDPTNITNWTEIDSVKGKPVIYEDAFLDIFNYSELGCVICYTGEDGVYKKGHLYELSSSYDIELYRLKLTRTNEDGSTQFSYTQTSVKELIEGAPLWTVSSEHGQQVATLYGYVTELTDESIMIVDVLTPQGTGTWTTFVLDTDDKQTCTAKKGFVDITATSNIENAIIYSNTVPNLDDYNFGAIVYYSGEASGIFKIGHFYIKSSDADVEKECGMVNIGNDAYYFTEDGTILTNVENPYSQESVTIASGADEWYYYVGIVEEDAESNKLRIIEESPNGNWYYGTLLFDINTNTVSEGNRISYTDHHDEDSRVYKVKYITKDVGWVDITAGGTIQVETLPTAGANEVGNIYQYIGETNLSFTKGYFYECVEDSGSYSWIEKKVQKSEDVPHWSGTRAEYEAIKDTLEAGTIVNITDDYDDGLEVVDVIENGNMNPVTSNAVAKVTNHTNELVWNTEYVDLGSWSSGGLFERCGFVLLDKILTLKANCPTGALLCTGFPRPITGMEITISFDSATMGGGLFLDTSGNLRAYVMQSENDENIRVNFIYIKA